jgi:putative DNA primase/helicase
MVREFCREIGADEDDEDCKKLGSSYFIASVERLARSDPRIAASSNSWDQHAYLLGTPGGTVDLRTGELRCAQPADMITKLTSVGPADTAECPLFRAFLLQIASGHESVATFLARWFGYALTGETREHKFVFIHGPGGNGKSVLLNTMVAISGDYAKVAPASVFSAKRFDAHPEELARLNGARLVTASETEAGQDWAEAKIKSLTGGDPITAREMYKSSITFRSQMKLTIVGNHQPGLKNVDDAMRRRIVVIELKFVPDEKDQSLEAKLLQEAAGILRLLIDESVAWYREGLIVPDCIGQGTEQYLATQDVFSEWLAEDVELTDDMSLFEVSRELFQSWSRHAELAGERAGNSRSFAANMRRTTEREPVQIKARNCKGYRGVRLRKNPVKPRASVSLVS